MSKNKKTKKQKNIVVSTVTPNPNTQRGNGPPPNPNTQRGNDPPPNPNNQDKDRLDEFESLFSSLIVGLAIAVLLAAWLAPTQFFNWDRIDFNQYKIFYKEKNILIPEGKWVFQNTNDLKIINPNDFFLPDPPSIKMNSSIEFLIYILLCLWIIKYLLEGSLIKYHKKQAKYSEFKPWENAVLLFTKILFFISLYYLIIEIFLNNEAKLNDLFQNHKDKNVVFVGFVFFVTGFLIPDIIGFYNSWFVNTDLIKINKFRYVYTVWIVIDGIFVFCIATYFGLFFKKPLDPDILGNYSVVLLIFNTVVDFILNWKFFFDPHYFSTQNV